MYLVSHEVYMFNLKTNDMECIINQKCVWPPKQTPLYKICPCKTNIYCVSAEKFGDREIPVLYVEVNGEAYKIFPKAPFAQWVELLNDDNKTLLITAEEKEIFDERYKTTKMWHIYKFQIL